MGQATTSWPSAGELEIREGGVAVYARGLAGQVGAEFAAEHELGSYGADFWSQTYDGASPLDALTTAVTDRMTLDCATWTLAADLEAPDGAGARAIVAEAPAPDAATTTDATEYERLRSATESLNDELRAALLEQEPPSEGQLTTAFAGLDDVYKQTHLALTLWRIDGFSGSAEDLVAAGDLGALAQSRDLDSLVAAVATVSPQAEVSEVTVDSQEASKEDLFAAHAAEHGGQSEPGDVLPGFTTDQLLVVVERRGGELLTLEQAPQMARNAYVNALLDERVSELAQAQPLAVERDLRPVLERTLAPRS